MKRAFTMIELLLAVVLVGVVTSLAIMTFSTVSRTWQMSTDYIDKNQRSDYALNQIVSALRSMYYPHDGKQNGDYGFILTDNGDGEDPDNSDKIEWSKTGPAIIGNTEIADTVHRVQVMILEEGNSDFRTSDGRRIPIEVTGLYARRCPDIALRSKTDADGDEIDYSFSNDEMYAPVLIADGIVGFNCRVMKSADDAEGSVSNGSENDKDAFEDEFTESNAVPYKVELTFRLADPEGRGYRSNTAPIIRIIRIPIHEQSLDGATTPTDSGAGQGGAGGGNRGGTLPPGGARAGGAGAGAGAGGQGGGPAP